MKSDVIMTSYIGFPTRNSVTPLFRNPNYVEILYQIMPNIAQVFRAKNQENVFFFYGIISQI